MLQLWAQESCISRLSSELSESSWFVATEIVTQETTLCRNLREGDILPPLSFLYDKDTKVGEAQKAYAVTYFGCMCSCTLSTSHADPIETVTQKTTLLATNGIFFLTVRACDLYDREDE